MELAIGLMGLSLALPPPSISVTHTHTGTHTHMCTHTPLPLWVLALFSPCEDRLSAEMKELSAGQDG